MQHADRMTVVGGRVAWVDQLTDIADVFASMPDGTVVSDRCAAKLWGLWVPDSDVIEVTSPGNTRGSRNTTSVQRRTVVAHRRMLDEVDIVDLYGLQVTSISRTWIDLSSILDVYDLVAVGDSALRAGAAHGELTRRASQHGRQRGIRNARIAAPLVNRRSRSRPESRIRAALVLAGLPTPRVNEAVRDEHGGWLAEPDLHYPEARLALEFNGSDHAELDRMRRDATRLLSLQRAGWEVRTYTAVDALRRLDDIVGDVGSAPSPARTSAADRHGAEPSSDVRR